jgi:hypothetical protein
MGNWIPGGRKSGNGFARFAFFWSIHGDCAFPSDGSEGLSMTQEIREARNGGETGTAPVRQVPQRDRQSNSFRRPKATLVHQMPGRTRFRIAHKRNDQEYFNTVADRLRDVPGVTGVETNASTGSILVHHDGQLNDFADAIFGDSDLGKLVEFIMETPPVARRLRSEIEILDGAVQRFSAGEIDLGTLASFGLLGLAAVQLVMGQQLASAVSLAWYAAELVRRSSNGEPIGTPPG